MSDALEEHDRKVSVCGRSITNLQFAYNIDALAEAKQELVALDISWLKSEADKLPCHFNIIVYL